jgi:ribosomal protein L30/L7E
MTAKMLSEEVFSAFQVEMPALDKDEYSLEEFLAIIKIHPELLAVTVEKERYGYMVNDTICEYAMVWINGALVETINSESTEVEDIKKTIEMLGLHGIENINYLQAIKRVTGMIDKKLAN